MTKSQGQNEKKTGSSSAEKPSKNPKEETGNNKKSDQPVSYTHLTLPTNREV